MPNDTRQRDPDGDERWVGLGHDDPGVTAWLAKHHPPADTSGDACGPEGYAQARAYLERQGVVLEGEARLITAPPATRPAAAPLSPRPARAAARPRERRDAARRGSERGSPDGEGGEPPPDPVAFPTLEEARAEHPAAMVQAAGRHDVYRDDLTFGKQRRRRYRKTAKRRKS